MIMQPALKKLLHSTIIPFANRLGAHRLSASSPKLWVLMYHRVLPKNDSRFELEEPGMVVTPETFAMHMSEVKRHFDVISLPEWINLKQQSLPLPRKACVITFDDGWADNYDHAFPVMQAEKIPVTVFAVAEKIGTNFQFWPNIIMALLMGNPSALSEMQKHPLFTKLSQILPKPLKSIDREYVAAYISQLKQFSDSEIFTALYDIQWRSLLNVAMPNALMSWEQLMNMQQSGLITIGSHTCNHKRLTVALSEEELVHEIIASKKIIETQLSSKVDLFCFPNGDYCPRALELVKDNYLAAVTTQKGIVNANSRTNYELTRIGVHEEISHSRQLFGARLAGWL
ncbi:MAG: polysaccharide deacetylase family protein [Pseudomonadota bacterium]